jgi:hypothetical protein
MKAAVQPKVNDPSGRTSRFEQGAEKYVAVEKNQHQRRMQNGARKGMKHNSP